MVPLVLATLFLEALIPMTSIARGGISDIMEPREAVVRSAGDWQTLWRDHGGPGAMAPEVDFSTEMVVGVFLGARNTGGYDVEITGVEPEAKGLVVRYTETMPGPGAMLAQVITSPFHLIRVARTDGDVRFEAIRKRGR